MEVGARMGIPGRRRVPRPARTARRSAGIVLAILLALVPGLALQVDAAADDPVLGPWVDVLVVAQPAGSAAPAPGDDRPRLLAVAPPDPHEPGTIHLVLLARGADTWSVAARLDVPTGLAAAGAGEVVPVEDAVALVSTDAEARRTSVTRIVVGAGGLSAGIQTVLELGAGAVGSIDVDGDGVRELALTGDAPRPFVPLADCRRTLLEVLDARTLRTRTGPRAIGATPWSAVIGRFDGVGESIVALAVPGCDTDPAGSWTFGLVRIDPATGGTRLVRDLSQTPRDVGPDPVPSRAVGPNRPLSIDLDGNGRDEIIIRTGHGTSILEPDRGWRATTLDDGAIPLAVAAAASGPPVLALYRAGPEGAGATAPTLELRVVRRDAHGIALGVRAVTVAVGGGPDGLAPPPAISLATDPAAPPPIWSGDLAGTGCTALIVPAATFQGCGQPSAWTERSGPAWLSTLPLATYGPPRARRLLVAAGVGWGTPGGALASPSPAASALVRASGWRTAASSPFALEELDASDVAYFTSFPAAAVDVDPNGGGRETPQLVLGGTAGDRVFARLTPAAPTPADQPALGPRYLDDPDGSVASGFLAATPDAAGSRVGVIPVPPASTAGANPGSVALPLPLGVTPDVGSGVSPAPLAAAWQVSALGLNAYGMPSPIVSTLVAVDTTGPNVAIDPPFASVPWPLTATLRGTAEPGSRVGLDDGPLVEAAMNGAFEIRTQLAPWPQELAIRAVDEHGNTTTRTLDVVGGVDYRRLPWQTILVAAVLLGAAMSTWRGPAALRRTRAMTGLPVLAHGSRPSGSIGDPIGRTTPAGRRGRTLPAVGGPPAEPVGEIEDLP